MDLNEKLKDFIEDLKSKMNYLKKKFSIFMNQSNNYERNYSRIFRKTFREKILNLIEQILIYLFIK